MNNCIKISIVVCLTVGVCGFQADVEAKSHGGLAKSGIGQRLRQFVSKHIDRPAALAMAVLMLNGAPVLAEEQPDRNLTSGSQDSVQTVQTTELANIDADWELLEPVGKNDKKDFRDSFNYLLMDARAFVMVMHLAYLGESHNGEHLFIGPRVFIVTNNEVVINRTINTLIGRDGVIKENILEITERKHIQHPEDDYYDLTILGMKGVDMADYEPIATGSYPTRENTDLEMYSYLVNVENVRKPRSYKLGKRDCTSGRFDADQGFGFNSCLIADTFAVLGSPIVNAKTKRLVAMYSGQEEFDGDLVAYSVAMPVKLDDLGIDARAVDARDKIATTWARIKSDK